eukprot:CAMPEP_0174996962 /NCGR_PEP_ID=MMETSP0005-20121125/690_1 /TAXON_ID=420556 /ORGANISM="Ochromonas sp., Strain CCMP1393" /LENGTH=1016 /DNA_ID=CAMNT_0016251437 /DNA_START=254 /DNA_END=3301 /DNA_ORIENTATION=+
MSTFKLELEKSAMAVKHAARGKDLISAAAADKQSAQLANSLLPKTEGNILHIPKKRTTYQIVRRHLEDYNMNKKLARGATATVTRLEKNLVPYTAPDKTLRRGTVTKKQRKSTMMMNAVNAAELARAAGNNAITFKPVLEAMSDLRTSTSALNDTKIDPISLIHEELEYESGTSIYFGATIAIQARHGGFLSYNSSEIKASAHKVLPYTRFVVKNSEDHTDVGVMKYGDALWLQAGNHDVLGAQYGSLVDQKRTIQPALVSCRRTSMFKAQQYGRWIVLKRDDPMSTLGQPVLHDDKIMLEQEWCFLASVSPYESSMYKTISNSDEAMRTKIDLFQPGDECSWKIHLVALPSDDKTGEMKRQLLLQQAKENIEDSANARYEKGPALVSSLQSKLPNYLTDDANVFNNLRRKLDISENQAYLVKRYHDMHDKQFLYGYDPTKFLSFVYGPRSNIVQLKTITLSKQGFIGAEQKAKQAEALLSGRELAPELVVDPIEKAHDEYWDNAQRVLLHTKSWVELPSAMNAFYSTDRSKKISAALVLQKWIRKFLNSTFDYERAMKKVDLAARTKLQEKLIARRKLLMEHVTAMDMMMGGQAGNEASTQHGINNASAGGGGANRKGSAKMSGISSQSMKTRANSVGASLKINTTTSAAIRSASLDYSVSSSTSTPGGGTNRQQQQQQQETGTTPQSRRSSSSARRDRAQSVTMDVKELSQKLGYSAVSTLISATTGIAVPTPGGGGGGGGIFQHTEVAGGGAWQQQQQQRPSTANAAVGMAKWRSSPGGLGLHSKDALGGQEMSQSGKLRRANSHGMGVSISGKERTSQRDSFVSILGMEAEHQELLSRRASIETTATTGTSYYNTWGGTATPDMMMGNPLNVAETIAEYDEFGFNVEESSKRIQQEELMKRQITQQNRPLTANAALRPTPAELFDSEMEKKALKQRKREAARQHKKALSKTPDRDYGLPRDMFDDLHGDVNTKIGLKFLRAMSNKPGMYDNIGVTKKNKPMSADRARRHIKW